MRTRLGNALVGAVAVVSLVEALVRALVAIGPIPEPLAWYSVEAQRQADDLTVLADQEAMSKLVFVGTSMVGEGIDSATLEAAKPTVGEVHNLALDGAQTPVVERWLEDHVRPSLDPSTVVWGISSLDVNGNRAVPVLDQYEAASATRRGLTGDVTRLAERWSFTYRYRSLARNPAAFLSGQISVAEAPPRAPGELGNYPLGAEVEYKTVRERARIRTEVLTRFTVGEVEVAALVRELTRLKADGIAVLVVVMPVPPSYIELHPRGETDFDEFLAAAARSAETAGVPLVDAHDWFSEEDFRDHAHLRRSASKVFSRRLIGDIIDVAEPC